MTFPSTLSFATVHDFFLGLLLDAHFSKFPPAEDYQRLFWKWAIANMECVFQSSLDDNDQVDDLEIDARIYEHYMHLLRNDNHSLSSIFPGPNPPIPTYITRYFKLDSKQDQETDAIINASLYSTATLFESQTTIEAGTTGLRTWRASFTLAQYLLYNPKVISSRSVLELGSGTGFLGIIIAALQLSEAQRYQCEVPTLVLTDVNTDVLTRCEKNILLPCNQSSQHPHIAIKNIDWNDAIPDVRENPCAIDEIDVDLIIGADVVYDPSIISPLVATICKGLSHPNLGPTTGNTKSKEAYIAVTLRNPKTISLFLAAAGQKLTIEEVQWKNSNTIRSLFEVPSTFEEGDEVKIFRLQLK